MKCDPKVVNYLRKHFFGNAQGHRLLEKQITLHHHKVMCISVIKETNALVFSIYSYAVNNFICIDRKRNYSATMSQFSLESLEFLPRLLQYQGC